MEDRERGFLFLPIKYLMWFIDTLFPFSNTDINHLEETHLSTLEHHKDSPCMIAREITGTVQLKLCDTRLIIRAVFHPRLVGYLSRKLFVTLAQISVSVSQLI